VVLKVGAVTEFVSKAEMIAAMIGLIGDSA
jgi:hypothetical protein